MYMTQLRPLLLPVAFVVAAVLAAPASFGNDNGDEEELEFDEAQLYFELNDTDGDLGIHAKIDGEAWKNLQLESPTGETLLNVWLRGQLRQQGLTEFFFESAEPTFDELSPRQFFRRFPEGEYEFEGVTLEGEELEGEIELSHVMAGPPRRVWVNGIRSAPNCDSEDLPVVSAPVNVNWTPVSMSHPRIGTPNVPVNVELYQFVGEIEREGQEPEEIAFTVDLPPNVSSFGFPRKFLELSDGEVKFEIITRLDNGNQTAVESCFELE
jgi:hypothetical protein